MNIFLCVIQLEDEEDENGESFVKRVLEMEEVIQAGGPMPKLDSLDSVFKSQQEMFNFCIKNLHRCYSILVANTDKDYVEWIDLVCDVKADINTYPYLFIQRSDFDALIDRRGKIKCLKRN